MIDLLCCLFVMVLKGDQLFSVVCGVLDEGLYRI